MGSVHERAGLRGESTPEVSGKDGVGRELSGVMVVTLLVGEMTLLLLLSVSVGRRLLHPMTDSVVVVDSLTAVDSLVVVEVEICIVDVVVCAMALSVNDVICTTLSVDDVISATSGEADVV